MNERFWPFCDLLKFSGTPREVCSNVIRTLDNNTNLDGNRCQTGRGSSDSHWQPHKSHLRATTTLALRAQWAGTPLPPNSTPQKTDVSRDQASETSADCWPCIKRWGPLFNSKTTSKSFAGDRHENKNRTRREIGLKCLVWYPRKVAQAHRQEKRERRLTVIHTALIPRKVNRKIYVNVHCSGFALTSAPTDQLQLSTAVKAGLGHAALKVSCFVWTRVEVDDSNSSRSHGRTGWHGCCWHHDDAIFSPYVTRTLVPSIATRTG